MAGHDPIILPNPVKGTGDTSIFGVKIIAVFTVVLTVFTSTAFADYYTEGKVLYAGMQGSNVTDLQRHLKTLGYFGSYQPTGYFGAVTQQMVKKYQAQNYLVADGVVGYATAKAIKVDRVLQTAKWYIFIQASSGAGQIIISDLSNSYYASHYIGAKRVIW